MPSDDDKARKNAKKERNSKIASTSTESTLAHGKWRKEEEKEKKTTNHNYREKCCVQR